jgi:5-methyltetrahydropteroyltriglutamate--homocysteine methyltransferase
VKEKGKGRKLKGVTSFLPFPVGLFRVYYGLSGIFFGGDCMIQHLIPSTTAGSLPKPAWLAETAKLWSPWKLEGESLIEGKRDAVRLVLRDQEQAGIDIVSDGEQTRQHFVTTFIEQLQGIDFQRRETVRIRDRYEANVPV